MPRKHTSQPPAIPYVGRGEKHPNRGGVPIPQSRVRKQRQVGRRLLKPLKLPRGGQRARPVKGEAPVKKKARGGGHRLGKQVKEAAFTPVQKLRRGQLNRELTLQADLLVEGWEPHSLRNTLSPHERMPQSSVKWGGRKTKR